MTTRNRTHTRRQARKPYRVTLWPLQDCEMTLDADSAAAAFDFAQSRWFDEALDFIDPGYWSVEELPLG